MLPNHSWRVLVKDLEATIGVGVHMHERKPQRILVNVMVEGLYPAKPQNLKDCYNYDHIHLLVTEAWPKKEHTLLLEECAVELLSYIFHSDSRVTKVRVGVCKPDVYEKAHSVGVETEWTREEFNKFISPQAAG